MSIPHGGIASDEWSELQMGLGMSVLRLEKELSLVLALRESRPLRLTVLAGHIVLLIALPLDGGWIRISRDRFSISRERPPDPDDTPSRPYLDLLEDGPLTPTIEGKRAMDAANLQATKLLSCLFSDDRRSYNQLTEWAPLTESSLYEVASRIMTVLDATRPEFYDACVKDRPTADELALRYRRLVNALGRTTLLSTDAGSPWLARLATSFDWTRWTPSFSLARERDLWSTLIGARAASRFGSAVIEGYLDILRRAGHPLYALDAIVGLAAIGLRHPAERSALVRSLDEELARLPHRRMLLPEITAAGIAEARKLLTEGSPNRFASASWRKDAFNRDRAGRIPVFQLIAGAIECSAWKFVPASNEARSISPRVARETFLRAWGGAHPGLDTYPTSAFGRA